ncbi:MAG: hypothetical protein Q7J06_08060 [Bacteroidales bacterium]|nr:hypothetical protein [Bacteroidales bacterium]
MNPETTNFLNDNDFEKLFQELSQIAEMVDKIDTALSAIQNNYILFCHENNISINGVRIIS